MENCSLCNLELEPTQNAILSNEYCMFLQLDKARTKDAHLEGAGIIVPKIHRETAFDLSVEEWNATDTLLEEVKEYLDTQYKPNGYNLGWNCGEVAGQHIMHVLLIVLMK